jgi:hypothetical protein
MKVRSVDVGRVWDCMLCACVREEGGDGEGAGSEAPSLLSYTRRYVNLAELDHVFQVGLREPMHLCACVSEEGGGEGAGSEAPSLLSYTRRYVSFAELGHVFQVGLREQHERGSEGMGSTKY